MPVVHVVEADGGVRTMTDSQVVVIGIIAALLLVLLIMHELIFGNGWQDTE